MEKSTAMDIAKINDRLRKRMSIGQINIELSAIVAQSPQRALILKAVREFETFDSELDLNGDHSVGVITVASNAYIFRFIYGDERYNYATEIGKRTLSVMHLSEFRSLKLGRRVEASARKMLEGEVG